MEKQCENTEENEERQTRPADEGAELEREKASVDRCPEGADLETEQTEYEAELEALRGELEEQYTRAEDYLKQLQRLQAEFSNYRKRTMSEQKQWGQRAVGDFVKKLLPVIDNLDRALSSADEGGSDESISQGVEMIVRQLREVLQKEGIERIEAEGVPFDPQYHEAVVQQETKDYEHNHVMSVFQHGYEFGSRVLRPARVVVAKNPEGAGSSPEQQAEEPKEAEEHE